METTDKDIVIPTRPIDDAKYQNISKNDKDCMVYSVLLGVKNEEAFLRFHPEYADENGKLNKAGKTDCREFFKYARNREYIDSYRNTLNRFFKSCGAGRLGEDVDNRKDKALKKLMNDVLDTIEHNQSVDPEVLKDIADVAKRLGILKEDEERVLPPIRYLPERCSSCRYKIFVEDNIKAGNIIDD